MLNPILNPVAQDAQYAQDAQDAQYAQDAQDAQDAQGQWELALFLFDGSDDHTDLIGESSFGAAISACAFAAKWSTAVALLRQCSAWVKDGQRNPIARI